MFTNFKKIFFLLAVVFFAASCDKEKSFEGTTTPGSSAGTAIYTFAGAPGNCASPVIAGTFQEGVSLTVANSIAVTANVTTRGTYIVSSNTVNGVTFSVTDSFTTAGTQTMIFTGSGLPAKAGTFNFTLGTAGCSFAVVFLPASGTPPTPPPNSCKECSYFPICVGSKYSYNDTFSGIASVSNDEYIGSVDTLIGGKTFKKISYGSGSDPNFINCTNGETTVITYELNTSGVGSPVEKFETIIIKANLAVGATWTVTNLSSTGQTVVQKYKILSKGTAKTIGGINFPDVIIIEEELGVELPVIGFIPGIKSVYTYAKGVGYVESVITDLFSSPSDVIHSTIKTFFVP